MPKRTSRIYSWEYVSGKNVGTDYWNDTWYISVKGKSGIICYGEIFIGNADIDKDTGKVSLKRDSLKVKTGDFLGLVAEVCKKDPKVYCEAHMNSMLHIELMSSENFTSPEWKIGEERPKDLLDPTPYLFIDGFFRNKLR